MTNAKPPDHDALSQLHHDAAGLGRTPREAALVADIKQLIRENLLAEVRDEIYEYERELGDCEGVLPTVDDLLDRIQRDDDALEAPL